MKITLPILVISLAWIFSSQPRAIAQHSVTVETLKQVVAAFNAHDLDAVMSFFADDAELMMPRGPGLGAKNMLVRRKSEKDWQPGSKGCRMCITATMNTGSQVIMVCPRGRSQAPPKTARRSECAAVTSSHSKTERSFAKTRIGK